MNEGQAIDELVHELGATMSVFVRDTPTLTPRVWKVRRLVAQSAVYDVQGPKGVVECEWAVWKQEHVAAKVCVVWDRPTLHAAGHRTLLRKLLQGAGIHPEFTSHVWCFPFAQTAPPLAAQAAPYHEALWQCVEASGARYVMLLGNTAIHAWRGDLRLSQVEGSFAVWNHRVFVFPTKNPIQVIMDQTLMSEYRGAIYNLANTVLSDEGMSELGDRCVEKGCGENGVHGSGVFVYDGDGVPWCRRHWKKGMKKEIQNAKKQAMIDGQARQGAMRL